MMLYWTGFLCVCLKKTLKTLFFNCRKIALHLMNRTCVISVNVTLKVKNSNLDFRKALFISRIDIQN